MKASPKTSTKVTLAALLSEAIEELRNLGSDFEANSLSKRMACALSKPKKSKIK
jgi:hypothetical protein